MCSFTPTRYPCSSRSFSIAFLASNLSSPQYFPPFSFTFASSVNIFRKGSPVLFATSKSLGSWEGVILTTPVPNSISTYSSATTGISLSINGSITFFPIKSLYLSSLGFTATPVSPSIVSGLVVAITTYPSLSFIGYFISHIFPFFSKWFTSSSARAVLSCGHQFTMYSPL